MKWFSPSGLEFACKRETKQTHQGYSSRTSDTRTHVVPLIFSFPCTNEQGKYPRPSSHYFSTEKSMSTRPTRQLAYRQLTALASLCIHTFSGSTAWLDRTPFFVRPAPAHTVDRTFRPIARSTDTLPAFKITTYTHIHAKHNCSSTIFYAFTSLSISVLSLSLLPLLLLSVRLSFRRRPIPPPPPSFAL